MPPKNENENENKPLDIEQINADFEDLLASGCTKEGYEDYVIFPNGEIYSRLSERFLKPIVRPNNNCSVILHNEDGPRSFMIHRLVAELFLDNPNNFPDVIHLDGNNANNDVSNLKWCHKVAAREYRENVSSLQKNTANRSGKPPKPVAQYTKSGEFITSFPSMSAASFATGVNIGTLSEAARSKDMSKTAGGFKWKILAP